MGGTSTPAPDPIGVRAACEWVVERARDVELGSVDEVVGRLRGRPVPSWDGRRHYSGEPARGLVYLLVLDTLNFSFWKAEPAAPGTQRGYWALAEGLRDAYLAGDDLFEMDRLAGIEVAGLARWTGDLPMMEERAAGLRELAGVVLRDLGGDAGRLVRPTAAETAQGLAERLASFRDSARYDDLEVPFLKRAQIAAADLSGAGLARFPDLDALTCFADYKLPQVLRQLGAIRYSEGLARRVDDWKELAPGEPAEVEIRAATVVAVERVRAQLAPLRAFEIDWQLWALSQELYPMRPHHRVRTVFY